MISEERLEKSLKYLAETDEKHAEVTANVKYLERQLKRNKALFITADTTLKSISAKEQLYYASEEYNKATRELYDAEVSSTTLENKRDKEGLIIDIFRTLEASRRQHNI